MLKKCKGCQEEKIISETIGYCADCIRENFNSIKEEIKEIHRKTRKNFGLPEEIPKTKGGVKCNICGNECIIGEGEKGYCGLRENINGKIYGGEIEKGKLSYYFDPLPTNCVGEWVCGATGRGYPEFSYKNGIEYGYKNLAVFYHACSFNCLFCQNYSFKKYTFEEKYISPEMLASVIDEKTSCICYFGGDPGPQILHSIKTSEIAIKNKKNKILRICWETNGNLNQKYLEKMIEISLKTGGCIKFDIKAYDENLNIALCGVSNKKTLENFKFASRFFNERKEPPLLIASTLLVPGYVDEKEVKKISEFIADLNPEIPYSLLIFYPEFYLLDLPITPKETVFSCYEIARNSGLKNVHIGNLHLLK